MILAVMLGLLIGVGTGLFIAALHVPEIEGRIRGEELEKRRQMHRWEFAQEARLRGENDELWRANAYLRMVNGNRRLRDGAGEGSRAD